MNDTTKNGILLLSLALVFLCGCGSKDALPVPPDSGTTGQSGAEPSKPNPKPSAPAIPLDKDGLIDYMAWLDRTAKVPPNRNAAITFLQILGPANLPKAYGGLPDDKKGNRPKFYAIVASGAPTPKFSHPMKFPVSFLKQLDVKSIPAGGGMVSEGQFSNAVLEVRDFHKEGTRVELHFAGRPKPLIATVPLFPELDTEDFESVDDYAIHTTKLLLTKEVLRFFPEFTLLVQLNRGVTDPLIGLTADRWYLPVHTEKLMGLRVLRPTSIRNIRDVAKLASYESRLDFAEGKTRKGIQRMLGLWCAARALENDAVSLIDWMVGNALESLAISTLTDALRAGVFSADNLREIQKGIAALPPASKFGIRVLYGERVPALDLLQHLARPQWVTKHGGTGATSLTRTKSLKTVLNRLWKHWLAVINGEAEPTSQWDSFGSAADRAEWRLFRRHWVRHIWHGGGKLPTLEAADEGLEILGPVFQRVCSLRVEEESMRRSFQVAIVLELYRKAHSGKLPVTLSNVLGPQAKVLLATPKHKDYLGGLRLTVFGDREKPDGYVLWYPQPLRIFWWCPEGLEGTPEGDAIGNDPEELWKNSDREDSRQFYIPITPLAREVWRQEQMERIDPLLYVDEDAIIPVE